MQRDFRETSRNVKELQAECNSNFRRPLVRASWLRMQIGQGTKHVKTEHVKTEHVKSDHLSGDCRHC